MQPIPEVRRPCFTWGGRTPDRCVEVSVRDWTFTVRKRTGMEHPLKLAGGEQHTSHGLDALNRAGSGGMFHIWPGRGEPAGRGPVSEGPFPRGRPLLHKEA